MATYLMVQGLDPVELAEDESFNKVRKRLNDAAELKIEKENGNVEEGKFQPFHLLSFKTGDGGRISVNHEKVIGVGSDTATDKE